MPEMRFHIRWPDGRAEACYSPSLVIKEHLDVGASYPLVDFLARSRTALTIASDRVEAKYGFPCSRALGQLARIEAAARAFSDTPNPCVHVDAFEE
ncbi:putative repeat protein (TIGR04042 family) [Azorhizobium sp. AG788]|uniref:MSMEG_0570 family nitrogen starvation response protein n=1 Tax=Azorhizobium sp. AG788 TaxID=2183897 RepID=UPI0010620378|nr:MSMEG_0570 family nitrogen starvation response protein [Azorhizobium sp. AG788]TDT96927.1 putative repeat protein (TIGR04042 family) [Azorhizobium sp. AG788]